MNATPTATTAPPVALLIRVECGTHTQWGLEFFSYFNFTSRLWQALWDAYFTRPEIDFLVYEHALRGETAGPLFPLRQAEARINEGITALAEDPTSRFYGAPFNIEIVVVSRDWTAWEREHAEEIAEFEASLAAPKLGEHVGHVPSPELDVAA